MASLHQLALSCLPGIGPVLARNLLSYCGDAEHVFKAKSKHLAQIPGIGPKTLEFLNNNSNQSHRPYLSYISVIQGVWHQSMWV
jgi:DNA processing protein